LPLDSEVRTVKRPILVGSGGASAPAAAGAAAAAGLAVVAAGAAAVGAANLSLSLPEAAVAAVAAAAAALAAAVKLLADGCACSDATPAAEAAGGQLRTRAPGGGRPEASWDDSTLPPPPYELAGASHPLPLLLMVTEPEGVGGGGIGQEPSASPN